jgi:tripartite-type tricarboxylate transporter receptor subunit TctC
MADTMGGQVTVGAPGLAPTIGNIRSGKLRLLAVWGPSRVSVFPDVPTVKDAAGAADLDGFPTWYGFLLPAGVRPEIAAKLEAHMIAAVRDPEVVRKMGDSGAETVAQPAAAFAEANRAETAAFVRLIKKLNVKAE